MKPEFLRINDKAILMVKLENGNVDAIKYVLNEINRLENLVKNYETIIDQVNYISESKTFKIPENL
jgi:hypothetical protein